MTGDQHPVMLAHDKMRGHPNAEFVVPPVMAVMFVVRLLHDDDGLGIGGGRRERAESEHAGEQQGEMTFHMDSVVRGCAFGGGKP